MHPEYPHLWGRAIQSIFRLEWSYPKEWLFRANDNPHDCDKDNITHNYNIARTKLLSGGYDALLSVEYDMIIPPDALFRLADLDADIAYSLYCWRRGRHRWSAYTELNGTTGKSICEGPDKGREVWGKTLDVAGVGLGCTLIKRRVLEAVKFRVEEPTKAHISCDWWLAHDAGKLGYSQRADLGVVCGHLSYQPTPRIIWPTNEGERHYRIEEIRV
uniref:Glycosyltransferase n=1 Tax=viral metagenome TaxID=1070528 RepID=A0A6M3KD75_9ZZZZ